MAATINRAIFYVGATASGKSQAAFLLAAQEGGEIVNADSRQLYAGLEAGTAQPPAEEQKKIPHHLYSILRCDQKTTAADYARRAAEVLRSIWSRGKLPIVVGGSGFYIEALVEGLSPLPQANLKIRSELHERAIREGKKALHDQLQSLDPEAAREIAAGNLHRVIRALELCLATGEKASLLKKAPRQKLLPELQAQFFAFEWPREELKKRIRARSFTIAPAIIREAESALAQGYPAKSPGLESLGYPMALQVLEGKLTLEEMQEALTTQTWQYAKRQLTWFRRQPNIEWQMRNF